jgi:hypothetical protein
MNNDQIPALRIQKWSPAADRKKKIEAGKAFLAARAKFQKAYAAWQSAQANALSDLSIDEQNRLIDMANRKKEAKEQAERDAANKARLRQMGWNC